MKCNTLFKVTFSSERNVVTRIHVCRVELNIQRMLSWVDRVGRLEDNRNAFKILMKNGGTMPPEYVAISHKTVRKIGSFWLRILIT
jgi:hypothetical protein